MTVPAPTSPHSFSMFKTSMSLVLPMLASTSPSSKLYFTSSSSNSASHDKYLTSAFCSWYIQNLRQEIHDFNQLFRGLANSTAESDCGIRFGTLPCCRCLITVIADFVDKSDLTYKLSICVNIVTVVIIVIIIGIVFVLYT